MVKRPLHSGMEVYEGHICGMCGVSTVRVHSATVAETVTKWLIVMLNVVRVGQNA